VLLIEWLDQNKNVIASKIWNGPDPFYLTAINPEIRLPNGKYWVRTTEISDIEVRESSGR